MTAKEFTQTLEQLRDAAGKLQAVLDRGEITATPGQARTMPQLTTLQLNRLAIIIEDAEQDRVRVEPTLTHLRDGSILATIDGEHRVIDRDGQLAPAPDHVFAEIAA